MKAGLLDLALDGYDVRLWSALGFVLAVNISKRVEERVHSITVAERMDAPDEVWAAVLHRARGELEAAL